MTVFTTCRGCKLMGDCQALDLLKKQISGLGVTTVRHRCALRVPEFEPGVSVRIKTGTQTGEPDLEYGGDFEIGVWPGVFIRELPGQSKVLCFIKPGTPEVDSETPFEARRNGFVKVPRSRVSRGDGERMKLTACRCCAEYLELTGPCACPTADGADGRREA